MADKNYTEVYLANGGIIIVSKPLNVIEAMLPPKLFFRIHKSYLINISYVKAFSREEGFHVTLENGARLDIASRRKDEFIKALTGK